MMNTDTLTRPANEADLVVAASNLAFAGIAATEVATCPDPSCPTCAPDGREARRHAEVVPHAA